MCVYKHMYALEWASVENFGVILTIHTSGYFEICQLPAVLNDGGGGRGEKSYE